MNTMTTCYAIIVYLYRMLVSWYLPIYLTGFVHKQAAPWLTSPVLKGKALPGRAEFPLVGVPGGDRGVTHHPAPPGQVHYYKQKVTLTLMLSQELQIYRLHHKTVILQSLHCKNHHNYKWVTYMYKLHTQLPPAGILTPNKSLGATLMANKHRIHTVYNMYLPQFASLYIYPRKGKEMLSLFTASVSIKYKNKREREKSTCNMHPSKIAASPRINQQYVKEILFLQSAANVIFLEIKKEEGIIVRLLEPNGKYACMLQQQAGRKYQVKYNPQPIIYTPTADVTRLLGQQMEYKNNMYSKAP